MAVLAKTLEVRRGIAALLLCAGALLAGCAPHYGSPPVARAINDYYAGDYDRARATLEPLAAKTNEDYVLNNLRLGSVALTDYDLDGAESAFYRAYEVINSGKVNDPGRATAAALLAERVKVWKGEPFERAMANFYLGLIYYIREDYSNARAAFENALFKLRDYGEGKEKDDQYGEIESNFVIAYVMLGKAWQKLGNDVKAADIFGRVVQLRPDLKRLVDDDRLARSNVLLVVDFGEGPEKVVQGDNSLISFAPHPSQAGPIPRPTVKVDGKALSIGALTHPPIDLLELAQDRRWQSIDTIRLAKSAIGTGLMGVGAYQGVKRNPDYGTAAALAIGGALLKASATGDVRYWEMLPRTTFIIPLELEPGRHDLSVSFGGGLSQTWRGIVAPGKGEATYYMRVSPENPGPFEWPPDRWAGPVFEEERRAKREEAPPADAQPVVERAERDDPAAAARRRAKADAERGR